MSFEQLAKKLDELGGAHEDFKKRHDEEIKELKEKGAVDPLLKESVEKANDNIADITKQIQDIKTAMNRPLAGGQVQEATKLTEFTRSVANRMPGLFKFEGEGDDRILVGRNEEQIRKYENVFRKYMRTGNQDNMPELKLLATDNDVDGGYLVPPEMGEMIITKIFESSPIRRFANVVTIGGKSVEYPIDNDEADCGWAGERSTRSETDTPELGMKEIYAHEIYAEPRATTAMIEDAVFPVEAWLQGKVADKFERTENTAFVSGNGVKKPRGFTTYPDGTNIAGQVEQIVSGDASALTADGLMDLYYGLKEAYARAGVFMGERATEKEIRKLKDSDNRYLWQPGLQDGKPNTLLGRPFVQADDMATIASSALPLVFADFSRFYTIVDRRGIRVLRDPYTVKGKVLYYTSKRVGGDVVNYEAGKLQSVGT